MAIPAPKLIGGQHLLRALGVPVERMVENFTAPGAAIEDLDTLAEGFDQTGGLSPQTLGSLLHGGAIPSACTVQRPNARRCPVADRYAASAPEFATSAQNLSGEPEAVRLERFLRQNPFARHQLEMALGGRIAPGGVGAGALALQPFPPGFSGVGRPGAAAGLAGSPGSYPQQLLGGLANVASPPPAKGGAYMPGSNGAGNGDVAGVLADPSLTVEDKITLMLMQIMKRMDKEIEAQGQKINALQQQQGGKGGGGKGGQGGQGNPSIDVESQKLSRLVQKRNQMFDILRQVIDKYNETAKGIIQSMSR